MTVKLSNNIVTPRRRPLFLPLDQPSSFATACEAALVRPEISLPTAAGWELRGFEGLATTATKALDAKIYTSPSVDKTALTVITLHTS